MSYQPRVQFDENGFYFVTCPDCCDARDDFADRHPAAEIVEVKCKLCKDSGDLCATIPIEKTTTIAELESRIERQRAKHIEVQS